MAEIFFDISNLQNSIEGLKKKVYIMLVACCLLLVACCLLLVLAWTFPFTCQVFFDSEVLHVFVTMASSAAIIS
ncbi:hypothetical protein ACNDVI_004943, partial [Escherichia coli]